jgi:hypothetical protein
MGNRGRISASPRPGLNPRNWGGWLAPYGRARRIARNCVVSVAGLIQRAGLCRRGTPGYRVAEVRAARAARVEHPHRPHAPWLAPSRGRRPALLRSRSSDRVYEDRRDDHAAGLARPRRAEQQYRPLRPRELPMLILAGAQPRTTAGVRGERTHRAQRVRASPDLGGP